MDVSATSALSCRFQLATEATTSDKANERWGPREEHGSRQAGRRTRAWGRMHGNGIGWGMAGLGEGPSSSPSSLACLPLSLRAAALRGAPNVAGVFFSCFPRLFPCICARTGARLLLLVAQHKVFLMTRTHTHTQRETKASEIGRETEIEGEIEIERLRACLSDGFYLVRLLSAHLTLAVMDMGAPSV